MLRMLFLAAALIAGTAASAYSSDRSEAKVDVFSRTPLDPAVRAYITKRISDLRAIHTPEGVERLEKLRVNGSDQWVSIRGLNRDNPILLVIHGGPGSPMMPASWVFQKPWEDYFTVVEWDQRGVGKNAVAADKAALGMTMSLDQSVKDAESVIEHLRRELGKPKVFVLGFSWGSMIGASLAAKRPDLLYAYLGVGQSAPGDQGEKILYDSTLEAAQRAGDAQAIAELKALAPYPEQITVTKGLAVRKWARKYDGGWYGKADFDLYFSLPDWAPEYTAEDIAAQRDALRWAEQSLARELTEKLAHAEPTEFKVPIFFFMGRYDLHTPYVSAKQYFDTIKAPRKSFVTFERSSHFPMFEEPGRMLVSLVTDVLPLAGPPITFAPRPAGSR